MQQDSLLAASLGVTHIERNGHHYVDGFGIAPAAEAEAFAAAHPGLYAAARTGGRTWRCATASSTSALPARPGFASAATPHWDSLQTIS